jgi:hypothetical protein
MAEMLMNLKQERSELVQRCDATHSDMSGELLLQTISMHPSGVHTNPVFARATFLVCIKLDAIALLDAFVSCSLLSSGT